MVCVWCDASFDETTLKCGCGIVIKQLIQGGIKETRIQVSGYAKDNNEAELLSIYHGILHIDKPCGGKPINVITDSVTAIEALEKCVWHGDYSVQEVNPKYQDICRRILQALGGKRICLYHCKGHSKKLNKYNQIQMICDKLARKAR